ncbi:hypothetical protein GCM10009678_63660 [Actinomadura kijaniata]|uniref:TIGR04222 domain-containing membrane protein n=1 Tax=Actinomadura namibiensis TaxID=182080 RepID=A0A7W3LPY4_ACTNM|nr:TIGR04222 domain-containing membrane protein [Actinomadura namibiensis]MBA8952145.1 hypothetical protein [Actinomadura namibiensis]
MSDEPGSDELGVYEIAYLCGGPTRVAQTALLALHGHRRIRILHGAHRVEAAEREPGDDVLQAVVLAEIPHGGRPLNQLVAAVAASPPMDGLAGTLQEAGLLSRPLLGSPRPTRRGRALRRRLRAEPGGELARFAALGTPGIAEARLREMFEAPEPRPERPPRGWAGRGRGDANPAPDRAGGGGLRFGGRPD